MLSWFFFLCVIFCLADRNWKISGCKTDSLINMALYKPVIWGHFLMKIQVSAEHIFHCISS